MCKAVGYVRVSTETQMKSGEGLSIQKKEIAKFCKDRKLDGKKIELVKVFSDEATSGADITRKGINDLLIYVAENKIEYVIIHKLDRLSRDTEYGLSVRKALQKAGVQLLSIKEESVCGNDPASTLMNTVILGFAQFEKDQIANRMILGRREKVLSKGQKGSGNCPFGYQYQYDRAGKNPIVVLDEDAAGHVKDMFAWYLSGNSLQAIVDRLNAAGIVTSRGNAWSRSSVQLILSNRFYTGVITFNDIETKGNHPAIINKITFGKVQSAMGRNRKR